MDVNGIILLRWKNFHKRKSVPARSGPAIGPIFPECFGLWCEAIGLGDDLRAGAMATCLKSAPWLMWPSLANAGSAERAV